MNKKTIIFIGMPASGHINPTLPIVTELVNRGHRVIYYATVEFKEGIERCGATFHSYPDDSIRASMIAAASQSGDVLRVPRVLLTATRTLLPFITKELESHTFDTLVVDSNALWGHMAARRLNIPVVSLMTTFLLSNQQYKMLYLREWVHLLRPALKSIAPLVKARSALQKEFGKESFPPDSIFPAKGALNIAFFPATLQRSHPLIDETFHFVGTTINDKQVSTHNDLPFNDTPHIYISLGTLHAGNLAFFKSCFAALSDLPVKCTLSVGKYVSIDDLGEIPANFDVKTSVSQLDVLKRSSLFITHGGMNSALEGLYYGVPLLLIPQQIEQLFISLAIEKNGAGLTLRNALSGHQVAAVEIRQAVKRMLLDKSIRTSAKEYAQDLHTQGGYIQAADSILKSA